MTTSFVVGARPSAAPERVLTTVSLRAQFVLHNRGLRQLAPDDLT
ncbi:hypothetical protein [Microbacterium sp.]